MIRLTLKQMDEALRAAHSLSEALRVKDHIGSREQFTTRMSFPAPAKPRLNDPLAQAHHTFMDVTVPRATILAEVNERRDSAIAFLAALGIELDPAGGQQ